MKKLTVFILSASLLMAGCAANSTYCKDQAQTEAAKAYIHSALQIAQVGYPIVAGMVGMGATSPLVMGVIASVDSSLDGLGKLAYNLLCPGLSEMQKAALLLNKAQEAKAVLGVK